MTQISETGIEGLIIIEPRVFGDERGYFFESFKREAFEHLGLGFDFVQDNEALSSKNIFRGFHYQLPPFAQTKLVRVITGSVLDVVIDIRPDSESYGRHFTILLSGENKKQLLVPKGFAHAYLSLEDNTIFSYKVDNYYSKDNERGISVNQIPCEIDWPIAPDQFITSEKDKLLPKFGDHSQYE